MAEYDPEGRQMAFSDGAHGGDVAGSGTHIATSVQENIAPQFHPGSVLEIGNMYKARNGQAASTYNLTDPMGSYLHQMQQEGGTSGVINQ